MTTNKQHTRIVITPGEPAGIGPDLSIMMAQKQWPVELIICADPILLINRAKQLHLPIQIHPYQKNTYISLKSPGTLKILPITTKATVIPGKLNTNNSEYVINTLKRACDGCINGEFSALVTGPVHKGIINDSGIKFTGHTEFFAKYSKSKKVVMMLTDHKLRIALMTTHIPISKITKFITKQSLYKTILILIQGLKKYFHIPKPKILICGLNPHAGENGHLGQEETKIITPTLNVLRKKGYNLIGPLSADTIFQEKNLQHADLVLAMYHDQGLPILKTQSFGKSVNITLGLPFIRTSVDHGTAIELAGSRFIKNKSMNMAIETAINMIHQSS